MQWAVFCDFDGTITRRDSLDALVNAFVAVDDRRHYSRLFREGQLPLWELLDLSLRACGVPLEQAIGYLHAHVEIDASFPPFHAWCRARSIPLEVVSAGVDAIVHSYLARAGLSMVVHANRANPEAGCFGLLPLARDCSTGVDKARLIVEARERGQTAVFIGDGFSDRQAVREADLVYAKLGLAAFCSERGIPFVRYESFGDVQADLARRLDP